MSSNLFSWVHINRNAQKTYIVIPGWTILPHYFSAIMPTSNLIILNPFINSKNQTIEYLNQCQLSNDIVITEQAPSSFKDIDVYYIFSMGLQWVKKHAENWLNQPCIIQSPSLEYLNSELEKIGASFQKSSKATLMAFYKQAIGSTTGWRWWRRHCLESHLEYVDEASAHAWLINYAYISIDLPDASKITVLLDRNDPIGIKPKPPMNSKINWVFHDYGHLLTPSDHKTVINL